MSKNKTIEDTKVFVDRKLRTLANSQSRIDQESIGYKRFLEQCSGATNNFLYFGLSIDAILDEFDNPKENSIGIEAIFPSSESRPIIQYSIDNGLLIYPDDPTCPYFHLVRALFRGRLDSEHDRNFSYSLLKDMSDDGRIEGQRIVDRKDVEIFREVLQEVDYLSK
jgi:hypothetical protein